MRDLYDNVLVTQVSNPSTGNTARTSLAVDLQGFNSANLFVSLGQSSDTLSGSVYWTLKLTHSNDDVTYVDATTADIVSGNATYVVNATTLDKTTYGFGYIGVRRYLKVVATPTGTHTNGTPMAMIALRGHASYSPVL